MGALTKYRSAVRLGARVPSIEVTVTALIGLICHIRRVEWQSADGGSNVTALTTTGGTDAAQHDAGLSVDAPADPRARAHGARQQQVITFTGDGYVESTFAQVADRADQLAAALTRLGVEQGDRVGTFMWNNQTHLEAYLAVPCMGAVLHTLEHPAVPRAAGLCHQSRRRSSDHRRRLDHPVAGQGARSADDRRAHHRQGIGRHVGARRDARLRHAARRRDARLRLPRPRRAHRHGHVLHERHHGQPEGRHVQPSQHLPALADGHLIDQHRARRE